MTTATYATDLHPALCTSPGDREAIADYGRYIRFSVAPLAGLPGEFEVRREVREFPAGGNDYWRELTGEPMIELSAEQARRRGEQWALAMARKLARAAK